MTISISFPPEVDQQLREQATAAGLAVDDYVRKIVLDRLLAGELARSKPRLSHAEFKAALQKIIDSHPRAVGEIDDSRDSIYAGRGE